MTREARLKAAFVMVADTRTADYDVMDLLPVLVSECTEIVDAQAGGLILADSTGQLQVVASTSERADCVEVMQLAASPPRDSPRAGLFSVHATPMGLRGEIIGSTNLFGILQKRIASRSQVVTEQLQGALDDRALTEQATGVLSQSGGLSMDEAFLVLRASARNHPAGRRGRRCKS